MYLSFSNFNNLILDFTAKRWNLGNSIDPTARGTIVYTILNNKKIIEKKSTQSK
jgi:hypothetical protein